MPYEPPPGGGSGGAAASLETTGDPVVVSAAAPPANGDVLTATSPTTADWQPSGGSLLKIATVTLTGAQLAAINGTPVTAIAAQGAGKFPLLQGTVIQAQYTTGTVPYTIYGNLRILGNLGVSGLNLIDQNNISFTIGTDSVSTGEFQTLQRSGTASQFDNLALIIKALSTSTGRVTASNVTAGNAGLLYAPGDSFLITGAGGNAAGIIDTVGVGGNVLTYHFTAQGTGYAVANNKATTTGGAGSGFEIDITAIQSVSAGDGTLTLTIPYIVVTLQ